MFLVQMAASVWRPMLLEILWDLDVPGPDGGLCVEANVTRDPLRPGCPCLVQMAASVWRHVLPEILWDLDVPGPYGGLCVEANVT